MTTKIQAIIMIIFGLAIVITDMIISPTIPITVFGCLLAFCGIVSLIFNKNGDSRWK